MADAKLCLRLKPAGVHAHMDPDGVEAIIISYKSGKYYTVTGGGAAIVGGLASGPVNMADVLRIMTENGQTSDQLQAFVDNLLSEELCEWYNYDGEPSAVAFKGDFSLREIHVHADLMNVLTMDPIHEVGAEGWPSRP